MFLIDLTQAFDTQKIPYLLVGGYALALQGIVRATVDIDLVVSLKEAHLAAAEKVLNDFGLTCRIPVRAKELANFHEQYRSQRNLIAWSFVDYKDHSRQVDLLLHPPLKSLKVDRIKVHGRTLNVATKKTLLKMKQASNRPEDQLDILKLIEAIANEKK